MDFFEKAKAGWIAEEVVRKAYQVHKLPPSLPWQTIAQQYSQCLRMIQGIRELGVWFMDGNSSRLLYSFTPNKTFLTSLR